MHSTIPCPPVANREPSGWISIEKSGLPGRNTVTNKVTNVITAATDVKVGLLTGN